MVIAIIIAIAIVIAVKHIMIIMIIGCGQMGSTLMGAAAKGRNLDGLGKKIRHGAFGRTKVG